jgi:hypothetical protein
LQDRVTGGEKFELSVPGVLQFRQAAFLPEASTLDQAYFHSLPESNGGQSISRVCNRIEPVRLHTFNKRNFITS